MTVTPSDISVTKTSCSDVPDLDLSEWMSQLPSFLRRKPLSQLSIPGSHNSFTYSLDRQSQVGPDESEWLRKISRRCGWIANPIIFRWAVCQSVSCTGQLEMGVRYFDFRLGNRACRAVGKRMRSESKSKMAEGRSRVDICIIHALFGCDIACALTEIRNFLETHKREVVILDFQHFYGFKKHESCYVTNLVLSTFKGLMCPVKSNVSLDLMNELGHQLIVISNNGSATSELFWPRYLCPNPWANTTKIERLRPFLDDGLEERDREKLFVSQGILTPNNSTLLWHPFGTLKSCLVKKCNGFLKRKWIPSLKEKGTVPNIVITDFVEEGNLPKEIIDLNFIHQDGNQVMKHL